MANISPQRSAPLPTIRRLPVYLGLLQRYRIQGLRIASATKIAEELGLDSIQVRKDLAYTGMVGKPAVGFEIVTGIETIESFLGWDNATDAFLVGAGSLGTALMGYEGFRRHGLNIVAAFDRSDEIVGRVIRGKRVLPMDKLPDLALRMHIHLGIIAVPADGAQGVADFMIEAGILAIWNFAPTVLRVPAGVVIQNTELSAELAVLSVLLAHARRQAAAQEVPFPPDSHPPSPQGDT